MSDAMLEGRKILITGPAGQIAFPLARALARRNEVWGIARFSQPDSRDRCEAVGITTRVVDLADPDLSELPGDFDYVLHLAASIVDGMVPVTVSTAESVSIVVMRSPVAGSQSLMVLSKLPETRALPSGSQATARIWDECPSSVRNNSPVSASQSLIV